MLTLLLLWPCLQLQSNCLGLGEPQLSPACFLFSALLYYHLHHHPHVHLHQPRAHVLWSGFLIFLTLSMFFLIYRNSSFVFIQLKATTQQWSGVESVSLMFHMTFDAYRAYFSLFLQIWIKFHLHYVRLPRILDLLCSQFTFSRLLPS